MLGVASWIIRDWDKSGFAVKILSLAVKILSLPFVEFWGLLP